MHKALEADFFCFEEKIERFALPKGLSVLIHVNGVHESVEESGFFTKSLILEICYKKDNRTLLDAHEDLASLHFSEEKLNLSYFVFKDLIDYIR